MECSFRFLVAILFLLPVARANAVGHSIIDGTAVPRDSEVSGAMAFLDLGTAYCSGVFISPRHILTAGHCVDKITDVAKVRIEIGAGRSRGPLVAQAILHPGFSELKDGRLKDDFGVLVLAADAANVRPAILSNTRIANGAALWSAGYGFSNARKTRMGKLLVTGFQYGLSAKLGGDRYADGSYNLVLTGSPMVCQGDSGGATFDHVGGQLRVVGIHSMADCESLGLDAYAPGFTTWIRKQLKLSIRSE